MFFLKTLGIGLIFLKAISLRGLRSWSSWQMSEMMLQLLMHKLK